MRIARSAAAFAAAFFCLTVFLLPAAAQGAASATAPQAALAAYSGASASCQTALQAALALSSSGKWKSAYDSLLAFDPQSADPYALALRTELCLDGFARSEEHRAFALKDLAEGETLDSLRKGEVDLPTFEFDPPALADAQAKAGVAAPAILEKALGDYFYDVSVRFSGQWVEDEETVVGSGLAHFAAAEKGGLKDALGLRKHAELLSKSGDSAASEALFRASLLLDPSDGVAHYGLAEALAGQDKGAEALAEVDAAIAASGANLENRFSSYVLGARTARQAGDAARSSAYLDKAEADFPDEPAPGLVRVLLAVQEGAAEEGAAAADKVYARFSSSPYVVRSLLSIWLQGEDTASPASFLDKNINAQADKPENLAILQFYKALFLAQVKGAEAHPEALLLLDSAEANFKKVYKDDNEVFGVIAQIRQELSASANADAANADATAPDAAGAAPAGADATTGATK